MGTGQLRSDVYTRLIEPDQEIEGNWFRATVVNRQLTQYHVRQGKGFMPMNESATASPASPGNSSPADTAQGAEMPAIPLRDAPTSRPKGR